MSQVTQIAAAFASIVLLLVPLGFITKYYWPRLPWQLIPVFGLIVYGGAAVPTLYLINRFSFLSIGTVVGLLTVLGLVFFVSHFRKKTRALFHWRDVSLAVALVMLAAVMVLSIAQQPVPSGIDPAVHSSFMTWVETTGRFDVQYPLGMHTFILFFEGLLQINRAYIMQAFAAFLYVNFFVLVYSLLKHITGKRIIGWLGVMAAVLDASYYNNLLNGSLTHILAVDLIFCYLLYLETLKQGATRVQTFILLLLSTALVYFHFISWYLVLPAFWIQRLILQRHRLQDLLTTVVVLLLSIPLVLRLRHSVGYYEIAIWTTTLIVGIELLLYLFGKYIFRLLNRHSLRLILNGVAVALFIYYRSKIFSNWEQWYGWSVTALGIVGLCYLSIKRQANWHLYSLLFSVYVVLFSAFSWTTTLTSKIGVVKELLFYYGLTVSLVLFAAIGLYCFIILGASRRSQSLKIAVGTFMVILVFASRMLDKQLIAGSNAISRYNNNNGFGIFFQKNDVLLADWFRENIGDASVIANPGGLYGVWTSMTGHQTVYAAYSQINVAEPAASNQEVINLMTDGAGGRPTALLSNNVGYLFVPQAVPADIAHPYLTLLKQIGTSRVYRILDQPETTDRVITLNPLLSDLITDVRLTGDYKVQTPLNGNRFYYQFQHAVQRVTVESTKSIQLTFDETATSRSLVLKIKTASTDLAVMINGTPVDIQEGLAGEITIETEIPAEDELKIIIRNTGEASATISNIIAQLHQ